MSTTTIPSTHSAADLATLLPVRKPRPIADFLSTYVFSKDHKVIGLQFLFSTLLWFLVGGLLALAVRWQVAWPWSDVPVLGKLFAQQGGQMSPEFYTMLFTMHATVMIFLVIIPILAGAFGNFLIPLMIGADDMAFPTLNMLSYWFMWPAFFAFGASFFVEGGAASSGWTSYPTLSTNVAASPGSGMGQTLWLVGLTMVGVSSMLGSVNYMTTIILMRAPGMTMFRLPMTIWAMFITAVLQAFALPVLTAAGFMQLADRTLGTGFFSPEGNMVNNTLTATGGGQPLLWQHLFWFYSHPAVYIMILPAMGMVSDILTCFARKPLFGYRPMVYSIAGIAGLGFIVWGHHRHESGPGYHLHGVHNDDCVAECREDLQLAGDDLGWTHPVYDRHALCTLVRFNVYYRWLVGHLHGRNTSRYFYSRHVLHRGSLPLRALCWYGHGCLGSHLLLVP